MCKNKNYIRNIKELVQNRTGSFLYYRTKYIDIVCLITMILRYFYTTKEGCLLVLYITTIDY